MGAEMREILRVSIPNRLDCLGWIYPICAGVLGELPFLESYRWRLLVAISEGVTNAFQHGNLEQPETEIRLTFCLSEKSLQIEIEDDAILPINENINQPEPNMEGLKSSGRGWFLIKSIADQAKYEHDPTGVNRLTMVVNFSEKNSDIANHEKELKPWKSR